MTGVVERISAVLPGEVVVVRGMDAKSAEALSDAIVKIVGHREFIVVSLPPGADLEVLDRATLQAALNKTAP